MSTPPEIKEYDTRIEEVRKEKEAAIDGQDFEGAASLRDKEQTLQDERNQKEQEIGRASCRERVQSTKVREAEDGIRDRNVTGVQTCALPISRPVLDCVFSACRRRRRSKNTTRVSKKSARRRKPPLTAKTSKALPHCAIKSRRCRTNATKKNK